MGPPTHNDPSYSNDSSSGAEEKPPEEPVKKIEPDPDDSPDMKNLALPDCEPDDGSQFGKLEIHLPKELFDGLMAKPKIKGEPDDIPRPSIEESSAETEPGIGLDDRPDIDIDMPFLFRANIEKPDYPFDENSWPKADHDCIPQQPGHSNEMGFELPPMPDGVPGEPQIG